MKIIKRSAVALFLLVTGIGCHTGDSSAKQADKYWAGLHDNQARIIAKIDGKPFYPSESIFSGQIIMSDNVLNLTLTDQFDGRTILNLAGEKWYSHRPVSARIDNYDEGGTSLKMGKIVDRAKLVGEGYMMTKGDIIGVTFEKDKVVFELKGEVAKYSDFEKPDSYLPFEALVVYKKPAVSLGDMSEQEIFGSTHTN